MSNEMIAILDYGMGNVGSIHNMLKRVGSPSVITNDPQELRSATKIILPGVGAFDQAITKLRNLDLIGLMNELVLEKQKPILGICLGMQLLSKSSEEGDLPGLGWIDAKTVRFRTDSNGKTFRIPHMGWNQVKVVRGNSIMDNLPDEPRFYFVHSYHVHCVLPEDVVAVAEYGEVFHCAIQRQNIYGTQFHPEKSHKFGMKLLKNFAEA